MPSNHRTTVFRKSGSRPALSDSGLCSFTKLVARANSYLKGNLIRRGVLTIKDHREERDLITAIKRIQTQHWSV